MINIPSVSTISLTKRLS